MFFSSRALSPLAKQISVQIPTRNGFCLAFASFGVVLVKKNKEFERSELPNITPDRERRQRIDEVARLSVLRCSFGQNVSYIGTRLSKPASKGSTERGLNRCLYIIT